MFKNLNELEKCIRKILINLNRDNSFPDLENRNLAYALYCCCKDGYILNLHCCQNANGDYLFQKTGNVIVSKEGLLFLKKTSPWELFKNNIFSLFKGTFGFFLGIISTVTAAFIIWYFGWI